MPELTVCPDAVGWRTIRMIGAGLADPVPFIATVTYDAPQGLEKD